MNTIIGGLLTLSGGLYGLDVIADGPKHLKLNLDPQHHSKLKNLAKLAANALTLVGLFFSAVAVMGIGMTLWGFGPQVSLAAGAYQAVEFAMPKLATALSTYVAGVALRYLSV